MEKSSFLRKNNNTIILNIAINIFIIILLYLFYLSIMEYSLLDKGENNIILINILTIFALILLFYFVVLWGKITDMAFNLFTVFLISYFLFTLGQPLLFLFNQTPSVNLFARVEPSTIIKAELYTIICFVSIYIGALLYFLLTRRKVKEINYKPIEKQITLSLFRKLGIILFILTIIPTIYYLISRYQITETFGYGAIYNNLDRTLIFRISSFFSEYFTICLVMLIIGFKDYKKVSSLLILITILFSTAYFLVGERAFPTGILVGIMWFRYTIIQKVKWSTFIKIIIPILVLLLIYPIIGEMRNEGVITFSSIKSSATDQTQNNAIVESIGTFGYSMFPLVKTMELVPNNNSYQLGLSYIYALTTIIPNVFGGVHIGAQKSSLGTWLMNELNMNSGPGYSIPAEAYYNFGLFPVGGMMILGIIFAWLLTIKPTDKDKFIKIFFVLSFFIMNVTAPRSQFLGTVRDVFYLILPIGIIIIILKKYYVKKFTKQYK